MIFCTWDTACDQVAQRVIALLGRRVLVLVAGGSCSGKSFFSHQLQNRLHRQVLPLTYVFQDDYFKNIDDPTVPREAGVGVIFDSPDSYHMDEFYGHINLLLRGHRVTGPCYDVAKNIRFQHVTKLLQPADVILAEGLFVLQKGAINYQPLIKVFIDTDQHIRLERRIKRDKQFGVSEAVIRRLFYQKVEKYHQRYVQPQMASADFVINR